MIGWDGKRRVKGTKVHVLATKEGIPLCLMLSRGSLHDSKMFFDLVSSLKLKGARGRPRSRPDELAADKAYDSRKVREYLRSRGIRASIPRRRVRRQGKRGRPYRFIKERYLKGRCGVDRFFGWLKSFRRLALRYERLVDTFMGFVLFASFLIAWRFLQ